MCGCDEEFGDRIVNIGREHYAVCEEHRYFWHIGSNLFSAWRDETQAEWDANASELALYSEPPSWLCNVCHASDG